MNQQMQLMTHMLRLIGPLVAVILWSSGCRRETPGSAGVPPAGGCGSA